MKHEQKAAKLAKKEKKILEKGHAVDDSNEDDEYDDQAASDDNNFIASDNEVLREEAEALRREKKRLRKEKREERKKRKQQGIRGDESDPEALIDEEDLELINENKSRPRKLKKIGGAQAVDSDDEQEQIHESIAMVKREDLDRKRQVKKQIFEKRGESTAVDEDQIAQLNPGQQLKDKFVTEDIDDLFGTPQDLEIVEKDIPERLQIKIGDRLSPMDQEIQSEADWIFNNIIESLADAGKHDSAQRFADTKAKICKVLKLFRCENCDVPYITKYRMSDLVPELAPEDIWRIFNLDIEYGKFQIQKKQCDDFFQKLSEFGNANQMDHYKNQIFYTKNQRDLNDFVPLMNFYKSYYSKELASVMSNTGKKLPVQKKEFVSNARERKLDEFSRRCMLNPIQLVENIQEDRQLHKPNQPPNLGPTDMAKEYILAPDDGGLKSPAPTGSSEPLEIIKDMCVYSAIELQCQPDIRRGFKKHIRDYGIILTEPTEKGRKELDVFHPSYRVKRVQKKLKELADTDLFLEILQNESLGLISFQIQIHDDNEDERIGNKYFQNMFEKFKYPEDTTKWRFLRREIFEIFSSQSTQASKGQKSFLSSILEEIKLELKEDAESFVTNCCSQKYQELLSTGYFKIHNEQRQFNQRDSKKVRAVEEDLIPQRERLVVMGAIIYPLDNRNFQTTVSVVDQYGELIAHKDFLYIIPPRKPRAGPDGAQPEPRPGEEEGNKRHNDDKMAFKEMLYEHKVDLIVVSADCQEAKRLKKALYEIASEKVSQDQIQENDDDNNQIMANEEEGNSKEAIVIYGRPEVPKLFAASHYSQKLLKNHPFVLKKAICLARFEQDPLNEILNLWSPITSENQALHLNLHPLQKHINQARLVDNLEQLNTQYVNRVGIDINLLVDHEHWHNQLQFLSGLGPRKAQRYIQKLKSLGKPLYTRNEIYENKILRKNCFVSSLGFTKVRVPPEKRPDDMQTNILDQTRIHLRNYDHVYKVVTDCLFENQPDVEQYKQQQAVNDIIKNPEKLKELAMGDYKDQLKAAQGGTSMVFIFDQIVEDLMYPFMDFREDKQIVRMPNEQRFSNKELFYSLIDETERTFRAGMIVSATVIRIQDSNGQLPTRIKCRLENGLEAFIGEQDADFFPGAQDGNSVDQGSIVTGRVDAIKFGDNEKSDDRYTISLKCKQSHLRRHDLYIEKLELTDVPEEDLINQNFKVQEEQAQNQQKALIQKRKIQHQRFQNISSTTAISYLSKEDNGEFYFRPSSRGTDHLTLTWKFYESNIVHIDITEYDKAIGANIGSKLRISDETYENLQEIVERYITPCNRSLREVTQHPKFLKCQNLEELQKAVEQEKEEDASRIPYKFTVLDKYPQYVILAYIPKKELVKEYIKVKPRGYFFHHQYHYPFQNMINWFKQEFRTREYQRYLRKTGSPQILAGQTSNPSNQPAATSKDTAMQIDSSSGAQGNWGATNAVKNEGRSSPEGPGWGNQQNYSVKDERERAGGWDDQAKQADGQSGWAGGNNWGNSNENPSGQSPSRSERSAGRGRGKGGPGASKSRGGPRNNGGERPPYKRQRREDGDCGDNSGWNQTADAGAWGGNKSGEAGGWGTNPGQTPGGGGWDAAGNGQSAPSQGNGGWGQAATPGETGAQASQGNEGGWGKQGGQASQNDGGGW